ncbi:F-type H+-transporting ATPase subunit b [Chitinivorax tropicus]|uniref:ATP synthase subunit b n=1 Tax=Chitinivorax tropicus TaxID=714531 RepID=A0A840MMB1_9PROT|nr:F0F1 ATP synthase subunit B [Chitinivorax tropicus]MBB5018067.1 F-type H+-transporting ATPase subunit b [Chitinivorax tropicus]
MDINASLIGQAITFALLVIFTMKIVWPPLTQVMDERAKRIADGLAAADRANQDLKNAEKAAAEKLREAKQQASEIIAQAEKRASQLIDEAKEEARQAGDREKAAVLAEIDQEVFRAKEALRAQVAGLAVAGAEKILRKEIDAGKHADLLASIQAEL